MPSETTQERAYKVLQRMSHDGPASPKPISWTELGYERADKSLSRRNCPERAASALAGGLLFLAHHESHYGAFEIIHAQLVPSQVNRGFPLSLVAKNPVVR